MAILKEEDGRKVSMLVGKTENLDKNSFPTNEMCGRPLKISFPGKRFTKIEFHDGLDVRQNQEDLEDSQLNSIIREVFGIRLENPLGIRDIMEGNKATGDKATGDKATGDKEKLEKPLKNPRRHEDTPDNEKLTKEKELEKAKIQEIKENKKRAQDERTRKGEKEKKVEETETAM